MYDVIIIGAGPAGMTAAIYASRREMKTLVIGRETGGQMVWASEIENYPGFKTIGSFELIEKMADQVKSLGVEIKNSEIQGIEKQTDGTFILHASKEQYQTKTIIVAMGLAPRRLAIPGESELNGRGVSYCANCDGPLYKNKIVVVIGGGNAALDAAEVLSKIAAQVYLVHRNENFKGFEELVSEVKSKANIKILLNSEVKEIIGENSVSGVKVLNKIDQTIAELAVQGVFVEVGRIASTDLLEGFAERDVKNQIIVDEKCATTTPGIFAAGDVTQVEFKQITIACGQATVAALAAYQYLQMASGKATMILDRGKK